VTFVGGWSETGRLAFPVGSRVPVEETGVLAQIRSTGQPERIDDYAGHTPVLVDRLSSFGYGSASAAPVKVGGRVWGALVAAAPSNEPFAPGSERRLADFAELVAQALANADAYRKLAASRVRIVQAGDTERRRLERNLHDGAQQRLVSLALKLRLISGNLRENPRAAEAFLAEADTELDHALEELRELARGIHPAVLTDRGLEAAIRTLAERAPVPVDLTCLPDERLPESVEAAIYYLVAEAITNVAKYAQASRASVAVERSNGFATVVVRDDGIGGAEPGPGSGLVGLADRVEALGGRLHIESPPGRGTELSAEIPCQTRLSA
jgi:signal transduction histidine kinase